MLNIADMLMVIIMAAMAMGTATMKRMTTTKDGNKS